MSMNFKTACINAACSHCAKDGPCNLKVMAMPWGVERRVHKRGPLPPERAWWEKRAHKLRARSRRDGVQSTGCVARGGVHGRDCLTVKAAAHVSDMGTKTRARTRSASTASGRAGRWNRMTNAHCTKLCNMSYTRCAYSSAPLAAATATACDSGAQVCRSCHGTPR
jgi:hypothetical protein